jgi:hypothetical protein
MRASAKTLEQGRFAGVCVTNEADSGKWNGLALGALHGSGSANAFELGFQLCDAAPDATAICFELRFAGAARPDSATETRHLSAPSGEAR